MTSLSALQEAVIAGRVPEIPGMVAELLRQGVPPEELIAIFTTALEIVGTRFQNQEIFIPEMLVAAKAVQAGMEVLKPHLSRKETYTLGTVVLGTVAGDIHDIGKNLVAMMLEGRGAKVIDLGVNVSPQRFVEAVLKHRPQVLGLSALLSTTMLAMEGVLQALEEAGLRQTVHVIVGGAPVTAEFAREIGADGYAPDAASAVDLVKNLVEAGE